MSSYSGISSNATTLNFNSKASCIDVQSGIAVLTNTINYGEFVVNCSENQQFNQLVIQDSETRQSGSPRSRSLVASRV
jgi:hypothetical protein